eukprot:m.278109 g.278109  ORF g.278109 m.278109 type:complete len:69 (+) comp54882_c0_seq1:449-655(+)
MSQSVPPTLFLFCFGLVFASFVSVWARCWSFLSETLGWSIPCGAQASENETNKQKDDYARRCFAERQE